MYTEMQLTFAKFFFNVVVFELKASLARQAL
jgi:hypothetical protein